MASPTPSPTPLSATSFVDIYTEQSIMDPPEEPECNICSEHYDDEDEDLVPRNLACGHSFCSKCIARCMSMNGQANDIGTVITCPIKCERTTVVEESLVQKLPKNWTVIDMIRSGRDRSNTLLSRCRSASAGSRHQLKLMSPAGPGGASGEHSCDVCESSAAVKVCPSCVVSLCQSCCDDIHTRRGYQLHSLIPVDEFMSQFESSLDVSSMSGSPLSRSHTPSDSESWEEQQRHCKVHSGETTEFLCEVCCEEVCRYCVGGEHREHECRPLVDLALEKRENLRRMIDEINDCHAEWNKGFDDCHELMEQIYIKQNTLESTIKSHFHSVHSALHAKEEYLLAVMRSEMEARSQQLTVQADQLAKVCGIAKDLAEDCEDLVPSNVPEVIRNADYMLAQAQPYVRSEQDPSPSVTDAIEANFGCEKELLTLVDKLGQLQMAPARLTSVSVRSSSANELVVSWQPPSEHSPKPDTYILEYSTGHNPYRTVYKGVGLEAMVTGCVTEQEDTVHRFRVAAANSVGAGPFSMATTFTQRKASFLWDSNLKHPKAQITNGGYTLSIGMNALWVSAGTSVVFSHGRHYWEVVLDRYGPPSMSRKVVVGVVSSTYHHWHRPHGVIGIKTCPIGHRSWGLACGTAKKLSSGNSFISSFRRKHNLFKEGDAVGIMLDLDKRKMAFYRNGTPLGIEFSDISGPLIPAVSFCRNKTLTLRFRAPPEDVTSPCTVTISAPDK